MLSLTSVIPTQAAQHQNGSAYLWWNGIQLRYDSSVTQSIELKELSPQMYWSSAWHWANAPDGGYGGIQTLGHLGNNVFVDIATFSIWNAKEGIPGEGANCLPFGGEGDGYSCRLPMDLVADNTYTITYSVDKSRGLDWWKATITDKKKSETRLIGTIHAPKRKLASQDWYNFIEYWGEPVPCDSVGAATARFYTPIPQNKLLKPNLGAFLKATKACVVVAVDAPPLGKPGSVLMRFGGNDQSPSTFKERKKGE